MKNIPKRRGSALLPGLMVVISLGVMATGFVGMVVTEARNSERANKDVYAQNVAEAGADFAVWEVLHGGNDFDAGSGWSSSSLPTIASASLQTPLGPGTFSVTVSNGAAGQIIQSIGTVGAEQQTVRVILTAAPLFDKGMTARSSITASAGVLIDSYNFNDDGAYDLADSDDGGDIGTNSTLNGAIDLGNAVMVKGNVYVGPGGDPATVIDQDAFATVTGTKTASSEATDTPSVVAPVGLPARGNLTVLPFQTKTINSSGQYGNITVFGFGKLNITDDATVACNNFNVIVGGEANVKNDADVDIVVADTFSVVLLSEVNNESGDPTKFEVYGLDSATNITIAGICQAHGTFYAPNADLLMGLGVRVCGAAIVDNITIGLGAGFHFDESLKTRGEAPKTGSMQVSGWQVMGD